jgi:hypothetical protein
MNCKDDAGKWLVGVSIVIVPDGVAIKSQRCRLSLSLSPVSTDDASSVATVDIRFWPSAIAAAARLISISIQNRETLSQAPDPVARNYSKSATRLWQRIFTDGAPDMCTGFAALRDALINRATENSPKARVVSSDTSFLAKAIDGMSAAATATTLLQRIAVSAVRGAGGLKDAHRSYLREASYPTRHWWSRLDVKSGQFATRQRDSYEQSYAPKVDSEFFPDFDNDPEDSTTAHDAVDYFIQKVGDLHFWHNAHKRSPVDHQVLGTIHTAHANHIAAFRTVQGTATDTTVESELAKNARNKFGGLLCLPTLAKYFGLVVDVEIDAQCLAASDSVIGNSGDQPIAIVKRLCGRVSASFAEVKVTRSSATKKPAGDFGASSDLSASSTPVLHPPKKPIWTSFVIKGTRRNEGDRWTYSYFGPCCKDKETEQYWSDGLLKPGLVKDGKRRFELSTLDVTNAAEQILDLKTDADALHAIQQTRSFPDLLTRGVVLYDTEIREQQCADWNRKVAKQKIWGDSGGERVLFAEDLMIGYRIDVAMARSHFREGDPWERNQSDRWRTLTARDIRYGGEVTAAFCRSMRKLRQRDDGFVKHLVREDGCPAAPVDRVHQEVFVWTGESLAMPHIFGSGGNDGKGNGKSIVICPEALTVDLNYDLPSQTDKLRRPSPLREGYAYMFGVRLVFMNGCSIGLEEAVSRYTGDEAGLLLGKDDRTPFIYRRRNTVHAPDVLLPWDDRIVKTECLQRDFPGETITDLVVRSGNYATESAHRYLVPPRVTFDLAEQAGLFDRDYNNRPKGSFASTVKARLDPKFGVFPVARAGKWAYPGQNALIRDKKCPDTQQEKESRGSVLVLDDNAETHVIDFFADPMARFVGLRLCEETTQVDDPHCATNASTVCSEFWPSRRTAVDAIPILLELKKSTARDTELRRIEYFDDSAKVSTVNGRAVSLRKVSVALAPGATALVELYSIPPSDQLWKLQCIDGALSLLRRAWTEDRVTKARQFGLSSPEIYHFVKAVYRLTHTTKGDCHSLCQDLLSGAALAQVTSKKMLRFIHAVDTPAAPKFLTLDTYEAADGAPYSHARKHKTKELQIQIFPVVLTVNKGDVDKGKDNEKASNQASSQSSGDASQGAIDTTAKTWASYVAAHMTPPVDWRLWKSEEGGLTTFFTGKVLVDRLTTGTLRCEASWKEFSPEMVRPRLSSGQKKTSNDFEYECWTANPPDRSARLFEVKEIEVSDELVKRGSKAPGLQEVVLDRDQTNTLRTLAHSFVDGRARHLSVQLITTSRFTNYFPKGKTKEACTEGLPTTTAKMWVPCTFRPAPVEIDRILPVFHWTTDVHDNGREVSWRRDSSLRLTMSRDWYSSGDGEKLALVCWPKNLFGYTYFDERGSRVTTAREEAPTISRNGLKGLDPLFYNSQPTDYAKYAQYITRWGSDPIHLSGELEEVMSFDRFEPPFGNTISRNRYQEQLLLTLPNMQEGQGSNEDQNDKSVPPLEVCIVSYDVSFDSSEGAWYSDISLDHGASYYPFVQLGLVRYQPNAVSGLELSHPVTAYAQIPPRRTGSLKIVSEYAVEIEIRGIGFHRSEIGPSRDGLRYESDFPVLDMRLVSAQGGSSVSGNGKTTWQPLPKGSAQVDWLAEHPVQEGAELVWRKRVILPQSLSKVHYAILVEEYENMVQDQTADLVRRGPLFSTIVPVVFSKADTVEGTRRLGPL